MIKWINKRFNEFSWGQFIVSKFQFIITLFILIKIYEWPAWFNILAVVIGVLLTWFVGYKFNKHLRSDFQKEQFKGSLYKEEEQKQ